MTALVTAGDKNHPLTALRRTGVVSSISSGPPPKATIFLGGDTTLPIVCAYTRGYHPVVNDIVVVLSVQGDHYIVGAIDDGSITSAKQIQGGGSVGTVGTGGKVNFTNPFGTSAAVFSLTGTNATSSYGYQLFSVSSTLVTIQIINTTSGANAVSGQAMGYNWIGLLM